MTTRTLVLRRERLAELDATDLAAVAGGRPRQPSEDCPDWTHPCITGPQWCALDSILCP